MFLGFNEPNSLAVIVNDGSGDNHTFHLYVREKDPKAELWDGARSGTQAAIDVFNADEVRCDPPPPVSRKPTNKFVSIRPEISKISEISCQRSWPGLQKFIRTSPHLMARDRRCTDIYMDQQLHLRS